MPDTYPYQPLFDFFHNEHSVTLLEGEIDEIIHEVRKFLIANNPTAYTQEEVNMAIREELTYVNKALKIGKGITDEDYKYLGVLACAWKRLDKKGKQDPSNEK